MLIELPFEYRIQPEELEVFCCFEHLKDFKHP